MGHAMTAQLPLWASDAGRRGSRAARQPAVAPGSRTTVAAAIVCAGCGGQIVRPKGNKRFCSDDCRYKAWDRAHPRQGRPGHACHTQHHVVPFEEQDRRDGKALTQNARVLAWMRAHPGRHTPPEVWKALRLIPTSCRRAMSDLTAEGLLVHHVTDRRPGEYGELNSTWEAV